MSTPDQLPVRPTRGRPATPVPDGRNLAKEVTELVAWFNEHPATKAGIISKAAGLHPQRLGTILRGERQPQAAILDAVYQALKPYKDFSVH
jgi:ABC-type nitrate/sulfonate/bicarbonate transport system substrate-binding protein